MVGRDASTRCRAADSSLPTLVWCVELGEKRIEIIPLHLDVHAAARNFSAGKIPSSLSRRFLRHSLAQMRFKAGLTSAGDKSDRLLGLESPHGIVREVDVVRIGRECGGQWFT